MSKKVSVIIPVYNAHDHLRECLDSVISQTLKEIEIICVDDGSTDDSLNILQEYAEKDSRFRIIHQENAGAGAARNNGLQYATGEYLSILDCDDFFNRKMLEESYARAKQTDADIVVFRCDFYDDDRQTYRECTYSINQSILPKKDIFSAKDVEEDVFKLFVGWAWDKLFRTAFVKEHNLKFQEQRTTNDMLFVFNALLRADRISAMQNVYAHYRRGGESLSVTREKSWMCFYDALMALREEMYKIGCYSRFEQDYKNYCLHFSLWNLTTLKEPTHALLYAKLRDEWFAEMGLLGCDSSYFYNRHEYRMFQRILKNLPLDIQEDQHGFLIRTIQCCKDHGIGYTIRYGFGKIMKKMGVNYIAPKESK